jgi:hypothetical protein
MDPGEVMGQAGPAIGADVTSLMPKVGEDMSHLMGDPQASAPQGGYWEDRGIGGKAWHPASGASERNRVDNSLAGLPPEMAVTGAVGVGRAVAGAGLGLAAKTAAAIKAAAIETAPIAKYEVVHHTLTYSGVPESVAIPIAIAISGYKRGAKGTAIETAEAAPATAAPTPKPESPLELTRRIKAEYRAKQAASAAPESAPAAAAAPTPVAGPPPSAASPAPRPKSPQQLLNEEAIARRRAEYQAKQAAPQPEAPKAEPAPKPTMNAQEVKLYLELRVAGKTEAQARQAIEAMRAMNAQYGLKTPTRAETRFPKGQRGKVVVPPIE